MLSNDDQKQMMKAMATKTTMGENEVFDQDVSPDELRAVAGGGLKDPYGCTNQDSRDIYDPSFPNCAATVEVDSWCDANDACILTQVVYYGMHDCGRAWR